MGVLGLEPSRRAGDVRRSPRLHAACCAASRDYLEPRAVPSTATDTLGTVEPGKVADLVVLDADPLADIHNTQRISAIVVRGQARRQRRPSATALTAARSAAQNACDRHHNRNGTFPVSFRSPRQSAAPSHPSRPYGYSRASGTTIPIAGLPRHARPSRRDLRDVDAPGPKGRTPRTGLNSIPPQRHVISRLWTADGQLTIRRSSSPFREG